MASNIREFEREVDERVGRWEMGGRVQSPKQLCGDRPDLVSEVARRISAIRSIERALGIGVGDPSTFGRVEDEISLPGYELEKEIGRGRFGIVYRARDSVSKRPVAVKVVMGVDHRRIKREADVLGQIQSPHVVTIYESRELSRSLFVLAMELVERGNLQDAMDAADGKIDEHQALVWMKDVARGMLAAWQREIIHRDLKPANILIGKDGRAKVADFGLATGTMGSTTLTSTGSFMGTPWYMSPQQAEAPHDVDTRADIYSFGATFYHALTGRPPFDGRGLVSILYKHLTEPPVPPSELNAGLSQRTSRLLEKCLAKQPAERFQTFGEIIAYLPEEPTLPALALWVYKCNATSSAQGDWDYFFDEVGGQGEGEWGGTWCINNHASRKIIRERLQVGDLVLAWQTDKQAAHGLCRVAALEDDGQEIAIILASVMRFAQPVKLLEWKERSPALANGKAFRKGNAGTIFETTPAEAAEILRICEVDLAVLQGPNRGREVSKTDARNWWVFHIDGREWLSKPPMKGDTRSWACNDRANRGDFGLIYAKKPVSALVGVVVTTSKVSFNEDAGRPFVCDIKCRVIFRNHLTLNEMKKDPGLRSEPLIQQEFEASFGPPLVEKATLNRLAAKIPELARLLARGSK